MSRKKGSKIKREQIHFVEKEKISDYLTCQICLDIFEDPHRLTCGHTFCLKCINKWRKNEMNCPSCRVFYNHDYTGKDLIAQAIINDLQVFCINEGCPWKGRLCELENHYKNCLLDPKKLPEFLKIENSRKKKKNNDLGEKKDEDNAEEIIGCNSSFNVNSSLRERIYFKDPNLVKKIFEDKKNNSTLDKKNEDKKQEKISDEPEINDLFLCLFNDCEKTNKVNNDNKDENVNEEKKDKNDFSGSYNIIINKDRINFDDVKNDNTLSISNEKGEKEKINQLSSNNDNSMNNNMLNKKTERDKK